MVLAISHRRLRDKFLSPPFVRCTLTYPWRAWQLSTQCTAFWGGRFSANDSGRFAEFMNSAMKDMFDPTYEADAILRQAVSEEEAFKEEEKNRHTERTRRMEKQTHGIVRAAFEKAKPVDVVARNLLAKIHRPSSLPGPGES